MKGAVISLFVLCALIITVASNTFFVVGTAKGLSEELESVDPRGGWDNALNQLEEIRDNFKSKALLLGLTLKDKELSEIDGYLNELIACAKSETEEEFGIAKSRLISTLGQIRQLHSVGLKSVF